MHTTTTSVQVPPSPVSNIPFHKFTSLIESYYNDIFKQQTETYPSLSKDDVIVIGDTLKEIIEYSSFLITNTFYSEAKYIITIGLNMNESYSEVLSNLPVYRNKITNDNKDQLDKTSFTLAIKLSLLQVLMRILLYVEKDFVESNQVLKEIIHIQNIFKVPVSELAQSFYYETIIKANLKDYKRAKFYGKGFLKLTESIAPAVYKEHENEESVNKNQEDNKMKQTSEILEMLGKIYEMENNISRAEHCYSQAYYLNLGLYGNENINVKYLNKKVEVLSHLKTKYQQGKEFNDDDKESDDDEDDNEGDNNEEQKQQDEINNEESNDSNNLPKDKFFLYQMTFSDNLVHKGKTDTFGFYIPTTRQVEPMLISLYSLPPKSESDDDDNVDNNNKNKNENIFTPERFVYNLYLNKRQLVSFLSSNNINKIKDDNNIVFYTDSALNKILSSFTLNNKHEIVFNNPNLVKCVLKTNDAFRYTTNSKTKTKFPQKK